MAVEIRVPQLGESIVEATVARWLKNIGDNVKEDEPLVELETDKVNVEVPSSAAGVLERIERREGDTVAVNEVLALVTSGAFSASAPVEAPATNGAAASAVAEQNAPPRSAISPVAEKLAEANHVDLAQVQGSGAGGKILKEDVEAYLERARSKAAVSSPAAAPTPKVEIVPAAPALPTLSVLTETRREERRPMTRRRQAIAENLMRAKQNTAMLTTFNEVDMSAVIDVRKRRNDAFEKRYGVKIGFMSFFTKAVVGALKAFPYLNAEIQGTDVILKHYYDIGIAVAASEGLIVPIVRDADTKTFAQLEKEIAELAGRARENKLGMADITGGTFTITNGGVFGSLMSTPILSHPQVGILGMHKIQERPVVVNGEIVIRPMMYLALSYDHRIVDGSDSVRFLVRVKELLEDPETLLLEG
jgi:2-oxoglutarate dehydrogenase E2 component (dihydrolipoamide succinyltransferase)